MARDAYLASLRRKLADLDFQMTRIRDTIASGELDDRDRLDLAAILTQMQHRHDDLRDKLSGLAYEPDGTWIRRKAEWELEWDMLAQDFEERIGRVG